MSGTDPRRVRTWLIERLQAVDRLLAKGFSGMVLAAASVMLALAAVAFWLLHAPGRF